MKLRHLSGPTCLIVSAVACGQAPAPMAPSTPPYPLSNYFPARGLTRDYMARVEILFQPSQVSSRVRPLSMSLAKAELILPPGNEGVNSEQEKEPFIDAAVRVVGQLRFKEPAKELKSVRLSVLFLLTPCDQAIHDSTADYYVTICTDPLVRRPAQ